MASSNKSPFSSAYHAAKRKAKGGSTRPFYSGGDSREADEIQVKAHTRRTGGAVPGRASGGRADRMKRGGALKFAKGGAVGANHHPFSSATENIDHSRTTTNIGRSPGGSGAGHPGSKHRVGGHHGHKLSGHAGTKDHPGHHFQRGGVTRETYAGAGSNVEHEAEEYEGGAAHHHVGTAEVHHVHHPDGAIERHTLYEDGSREVHHKLGHHYGVGGEVAKELIRGAAEKLGETMKSKHKREDDECDLDDDDEDE